MVNPDVDGYQTTPNDCILL